MWVFHFFISWQSSLDALLFLPPSENLTEEIKDDASKVQKNESVFILVGDSLIVFIAGVILQQALFHLQFHKALVLSLSKTLICGALSRTPQRSFFP